MARPIFFVFTNHATHRYFLWLTENNPDLDTAKMVLEAIDAAPSDEFFDLGEDISRSAQKVLAARIDQSIEELLLEHEAGGLGVTDPPTDGTTDSLFQSLAALGLGMVDALEVAEALMRLHGKWSPDNTIPEIE